MYNVRGVSFSEQNWSSTFKLQPKVGSANSHYCWDFAVEGELPELLPCLKAKVFLVMGRETALRRETRKWQGTPWWYVMKPSSPEAKGQTGKHQGQDFIVGIAELPMVSSQPGRSLLW